MPTYRVVITEPDGETYSAITGFADDAAAINNTRYVATAEHPSVAVARGAGRNAEFLGAWQWTGEDVRWTTVG